MLSGTLDIDEALCGTRDIDVALMPLTLDMIPPPPPPSPPHDESQCVDNFTNLGFPDPPQELELLQLVPEFPREFSRLATHAVSQCPSALSPIVSQGDHSSEHSSHTVENHPCDKQGSFSAADSATPRNLKDF
jgi:hypothetical protein